MDRIYEVVFKEKGKKYFFKSEGEIKPDSDIIVETEKGVQYAKVVAEAKSVNVPINEIKEITRLATKKDYKKYLDNLKEASEALDYAKEAILELNLDMNIISSQYTFDKKQLLFNFIADDRVDFRELAKKLANKYKTRIELRQVGARDKAKEISGIGICGRKLCCSNFLNHMDTVSMNMAKNQNLALNPTKINGQCSRLLCCLTYEDEAYKECLKGMPNVNQTIDTKYGKGTVISTNILERKYKVLIENEIFEIELDESKKSTK